jgi:hypothetical protein
MSSPCLHPQHLYDRLHWLAPCVGHPSLRQFNTLTISLFYYSAAAGGSDRVDEILLQDNDLHDRIPGVSFGHDAMRTHFTNTYASKREKPCKRNRDYTDVRQ